MIGVDGCEIFYVSNKTGEWVNTQINIDESVLQYSPHMGLDSNGVIHVTWTALIAGKGEILYTNNSGNSWHTPVNLTNTASISEEDFVFVIDAENTIHGIYSAGNNVYYLNRTSNGAWSTPKPLFTPPYTILSHDWSGLTLTTDGNMYIVVKALNASESGSYHYLYGFNSAFSQPVVISNQTGDSDLFALASDRYGHIHLVYTTPDNSYYSLLYQFYNGSAWSNIEVMLNGTLENVYSIFGVSVSCDYDGKPHVAFIAEQDDYGLFYTNKTQSTWGSPVLVVGYEYFYSCSTQIQVDRNGFAHIVFDSWDNDPETQVEYTHTTESVASAWPAPAPETGDLTIIIVIVGGVASAAVVAGVAVYMLKKR